MTLEPVVVNSFILRYFGLITIYLANKFKLLHIKFCTNMLFSSLLHV